MAVTRTYNPLNFVELGWEQFEALIRGMVHKWHRWETFNHFGATGKDGGVDIKATDLLENGKVNVYHFQCKRYKKLTSVTIKKILDDYCEKNPIRADKYILVTACKLSAKCLKTFESYAREKGIASVAAWTKPELETMLWTQYYDLLFAFFGVDVTSQRSNRISSIRRNISLKHRMKQDFLMSLDEWKEKHCNEFNDNHWRKYRNNNPHSQFLMKEIYIRSIDDKTYPDEDKSLHKGHRGSFKADVYDFYHNGLIIRTIPFSQDVVIRQLLPDEKGGFLFGSVTADVLGYIPYNNIIDYDMNIGGDECYEGPYVFCDFVNGSDPFECIRYAVKSEEGWVEILEDEQVAKLSKDERDTCINSLLNTEKEDDDEYSGTIICKDCNKKLNVNRNTEPKDGALAIPDEDGEQIAVCFKCYQTRGANNAL